MKRNSSLLFIVCVFLFASCKETTKNETTTKVQTTQVNGKGQSAVVDEDSDPNALQVAMSMDDFKTLVVAVTAAGVQDALVNAGPLTVFAPINSAFDKLPEGLVESLLKPENKAKLAYILKNHVAPANYPIKTLEKNIRKNRKLYMASGKYLEVTKKGAGISSSFAIFFDPILCSSEAT